MPRQSNTQTLGQAIQEFLSQYKHSDRIRDAEVVNAWPEVMGANIVAYTKSVEFRDGQLILRIKSAAMRHELLMRRRDIVEAINRHLGRPAVREILLR